MSGPRTSEQSLGRNPRSSICRCSSETRGVQGSVSIIQSALKTKSMRSKINEGGKEPSIKRGYAPSIARFTRLLRNVITIRGGPDVKRGTGRLKYPRNVSGGRCNLL